jgi:hypothetical protein
MQEYLFPDLICYSLVMNVLNDYSEYSCEGRRYLIHRCLLFLQPYWVPHMPPSKSQGRFDKFNNNRRLSQVKGSRLA